MRLAKTVHAAHNLSEHVASQIRACKIRYKNESARGETLQKGFSLSRSLFPNLHNFKKRNLSIDYFCFFTKWPSRIVIF